MEYTTNVSGGSTSAIVEDETRCNSDDDQGTNNTSPKTEKMAEEGRILSSLTKIWENFPDKTEKAATGVS